MQMKIFAPRMDVLLFRIKVEYEVSPAVIHRILSQ